MLNLPYLNSKINCSTSSSSLKSCPICSHLLKKQNNTLPSPIPSIPYLQLSCSQQPNHLFSCLVFKKKIHLIKLSLSPIFSHFLIVDFVHSCSSVFSKSSNFHLPYPIYPDFPSLSSTSIKINKLIALS